MKQKLYIIGNIEPKKMHKYMHQQNVQTYPQPHYHYQGQNGNNSKVNQKQKKNE